MTNNAKKERIAKNFQMAFNQHFGYAKIKGILEIINLFSAFYAVVSKRFRTFAADISKTQTVRQSTRQIFSVGVLSEKSSWISHFLFLRTYNSKSNTYRCIDVPVVQMSVHRIMLIVEVVELAIGIDEIAIPAVGDGQAGGEVECEAVVA